MLVSYEVNHYLKQNTKGKEYYMALNLDMSKASDGFECAFLHRVLERLGFDVSFIDIIMLSVRTVFNSFLLNGLQLEPLQSKRGSPVTLFCFCLLMLKRGRCCVGLRFPLEYLGSLTSCLLMIPFILSSHFYGASDISNILHRCSLASGQEINSENSTLVFSNILPDRVVDEHDNYLGLTTEMDRQRKRYLGVERY